MQKIIFYLIIGIFLTNLLIAKDSLSNSPPPIDKNRDTRIYNIPARDIKTLLMKEIEFLDKYHSDNANNSLQLKILLITILISIGSLKFLTRTNDKTMRIIILIFIIFALSFYGNDALKNNLLDRTEERGRTIVNEYARISQYPDTTKLFVSSRDSIFINGYKGDTVCVNVDVTQYNPCDKIRSALKPPLEQLLIYYFVLVALLILLFIEKKNTSWNLRCSLVFIIIILLLFIWIVWRYFLQRVCS